MKLLDYTFYRIFRFYKRQKDTIPVFSSCLFLSLLAFLTVLTLIALVELVFRSPIRYESKTMVVVIMLVMFLLFWKRYGEEKIVKELEARYSAEELARRRARGWAFVIFSLMVLAIPVTLGILRHNLGWNI